MLPSIAPSESLPTSVCLRPGELLDSEQWERKRDEWLPTADDRAFIEELMQPEFRAGEFATWIAKPSKGIQNMPEDFLYVKLP